MRLVRLARLALASLVLLVPPAGPRAAEVKPLVNKAGVVQPIPATDTLKLPAATTANASINIPPGTAPTAPNNGDCWTTSGGLYCRIAGATVGPMGSATGTVTSVTCGTGLSGGTITATGTCSITAPVSVALGGTNATSASGTALDNISGFSGTGYLKRTGAGAYSFTSATNGIPFSSLAQVGGNSYLGNTTTSTGDVTAYVIPDCHGSAQALQYTQAGALGMQCGSITAVSGGTNPFYIGVPAIRTGIGAPSASSDPVGSLYLRTDTAEIYQQYVASGQVPALVQTATATFSNSVTMSSTPAAGDLLVATCSVYPAAATINTAGGWTDTGLLHNASILEPSDHLAYKFAVAGESTTQTPCTGTPGGAAVFEVSGVANWTASLEASSYTQSNPATYTTGAANDLVLMAAYTDSSGSDPGAGSISGLSGGASTAHATGGFTITTAGQAFTGSGSSVAAAGSPFNASRSANRLVILKPGTAGWRRVGNIVTLASGGTTITNAPISITFSTGLTATDDGLGNTTVTGNVGTVTTTGSPTSGKLAAFSGAASVTSGDLSGDCTTSGALAITCTKTGGTNLGTFATQNFATPPAIGGTTPAAGAFSTLSASGNLTTNITGSTQCVSANSSGVLSGAGSACGAGGGGAIAFKDEGSTLTTATASVDCTGTGVTCTAIGNAVTLNVTSGGGSTTIVPPLGRLTLVSGTPVMTSDQTAKSTLYYTCSAGRTVPYYDGSTDQLDSISSCEVSTAMQASSTGVLNSGGVFDVWWVQSGANRICVATNGSGGGWASDTGGSNTARGTGYSQVHNTRGYWTNVNSIASCYNGSTNYGSIAADRATYLGSIYTTAAGQTGVALTPAAASGGSNAIVGVFNAYNRVRINSRSLESTGSWTLANSGAFRAMNNSSGNRVTYVDGLAQIAVRGRVQVLANGGGSDYWGIGVDCDSTTATPTTISQMGGGTMQMTLVAETICAPALGLHYVQAVERHSTGSATLTLYGDYQSTIATMEGSLVLLPAFRRRRRKAANDNADATRRAA